ncbi:MAG TPA: SWIM zinc finger family protein [Actinomycetota bacterium]|nr:SWIM zinc finger family protein [Actinomycetota bacterium]
MSGGWFEAKPRIAVKGGVKVPKPGKVTEPAALDLVEAATTECTSAILARGRTYARAGQVIGVEAGAEGFSAKIQGSSRTPYQVRLDKVVISGSDRIQADCTCPYGCDFDWCKHAAALAYVAAFLVDTQPATRAIWSGDPAVPHAPAQDAVDLSVLRASPQSVTFSQRIEAAGVFVPWPHLSD